MRRHRAGGSFRYCARYSTRLAGAAEKPSRVFPGWCCKSRIQLGQKSGNSLFEVEALLLRAVGTDMDGLTKVQTEHPHKAFGIDPGPVVAYKDAKRLHGGDLHKILHIGKGM